MTLSTIMLPQPVTSGSLGFRLPQFSDDVAWLPAWLQPHVATTVLDGEEEEEEDLQKHFGFFGKDVGQSRGSQDKDCNGLSVKEISNKGFQLNLSGDDDSLKSVNPSCEKVLQFSLHLSTDQSSGSPYFPTMETSQGARVKSIELPMASVKASRETGETKESTMENNLGNLKLFSSTCNRNPPAGPFSQTRSNPQDTRKRCLTELNSIDSEDSEIIDAVEHSTAASEALVIHELIRSESSSDALCTASILELALRVKQTRLQWLHHSFTPSNSNVSISTSNVLSDLDDSDMEDAYEDVGLSLSTSANIPDEDASVSQVAETPMSKHHFGEDGTVGSKYKLQENSIYDTSIDKQLQDNEGLDMIPSVACDDDSMMHQPLQRNPDDTKARKKEEDTFRQAKCKRIKHIRGNLIESSYLSESADVASDVNSCVRNHHGSLKTSQSSIHMEGQCRIEDNGPMLCQDIAKETNLSFVDSLCSVIPCSISAGPRGSLSALGYDNGNQHADGSVRPQVSLQVQMMHVPSSSKNEIVCQEKQEKAAANALDSCLIIRRHKTSLNAYSMHSAGQNPLIQNDSNSISPQQTESAMDVMSISCRRKISSVYSLKNGYNGAVASDGAELQVRLQSEEALPHILCHEARHRVQAHRHPITNISTENEKQDLVSDSLARFDPSGILEDPHSHHGKLPATSVPARKRVRFNVNDVDYQRRNASPEPSSKYKSRKISSSGKSKQPSDQLHCWSSQEVKEHLTNFHMRDRKRPIFQGLDFLLTGFPCKKEKEVERTLRRYGGVVLADIPSAPRKRERSARSDSMQLPVIICTKKLQTIKFLYGCAVNAFLLQVDWVIDSVKVGSVLPPEKYMLLPNQPNRWANRIQKSICMRTVERIFHKVGIMLQGEHNFCFELAEVIKHGQGRVYKTLQGLVQSRNKKNISVGVIIAENEILASRHLRKCASEQRIPVKSTSWIISSIYNGKLLPFEEHNPPCHPPPVEIQVVTASQEWTQEI